jgi:hypothetical protein
MKQLILVLALCTFGASSFAAETKKVCVEQTDAKTKKIREVCKDVKTHKKLEGTPVPDKKAK